MTTATAFAPAPAAAPLLRVLPAASEPCCQPGACRYRTGRVRGYLEAFVEARRSRVPIDPWEIIRDAMVEEAGQIDLVERGRRGFDSHGSLARDIEIDVRMACADLGIALNPWNARKVSDALCPFARIDDDGPDARK